jgi:hypothetical protein
MPSRFGEKSAGHVVVPGLTAKKSHGQIRDPWLHYEQTPAGCVRAFTRSIVRISRKIASRRFAGRLLADH